MAEVAVEPVNPADVMRRAEASAESYGVEAVEAEQLTDAQLQMASPEITPDWVSTQECKDRHMPDPDQNEGTYYWHKNKFSSCWSKRVDFEVKNALTHTVIAKYTVKETLIGRGRNGTRRIDYEYRLEDWLLIGIYDTETWAKVAPGIYLEFMPDCRAAAGSDCGDHSILKTERMTPFVDDVAEYIYSPTTTSAAEEVWRGNLDKKGYHTLDPKLFVKHPAELVYGMGMMPQDDFRCDGAPGVGLAGTGGCVFTKVQSYIEFKCNDKNRESVCFMKDAFEDITRTVPGADGTWVPGEHGGKYGPLHRNFHEHEWNGTKVPRDRSLIEATCKYYYGGDAYKKRYDEHGDPAPGSNQCDEFPFSVTYENVNSVRAMQPRTYAVRPVLGSHNGSTGGSLGSYFKTDRILDGDPFFVKITVDDPAKCPPYPEPEQRPQLTSPQNGASSAVPLPFIWERGGPSGQHSTQFHVRIENADTGVLIHETSTQGTQLTPDLGTWQLLGEAGEVVVVIAGTSDGWETSYVSATSLSIGPIPGIPRIMVVGDSISHGAEADYTWRYRLKQHLNDAGVLVNFVGPYNGTNRIGAAGSFDDITFNGGYGPGNISFDSQHFSKWGRQAAQAKGLVQDQIAAYKPDILLVELGFNDLGWFVSEPDGLIGDMKTLIANARAANPNLKILVANVPQRTPLSANPNLPAKTSSYNSKLGPALASITTTQSPVRPVDINSGWDPDRDAYDGLHPNSVGEFKIARAFANVLSGQLGIGPQFGAIPSTPEVFTPRAPSPFTVTAVPAGVELSWGHSYGAGAYTIWARDATAGQAFSQLPVQVRQENWTANWVLDGHTYEYFVVPYHGEQSGTPTATASATAHPQTAPGPGNLTIIPGNGYVDVSWAAPTGPYADSVSGYRVYSFDTTASGAFMEDNGTSTRSIRLTGLTNGHKYNIAVSSINNAGVGWPTGGPQVIPGYGTPPAPTLERADVTAMDRAWLDWTSSGPGAVGYHIYSVNWMWEDHPESPGWVRSWETVGQTYSDQQGLFPADRMEYCIVAVNGSLESPRSNCLHTKQKVAQLQTARIASDTEAFLDWEESPGASEYRVMKRDATKTDEFSLAYAIRDGSTSVYVGGLDFPDHWEFYIVAVSWSGAQEVASNKKFATY